METTQPLTDAEEMTKSQSVEHDEEQAEVAAVPRQTMAFLITAVAFFIIGYGVAWFSFNAAVNTQTDVIRETVQEAVASAIADADLGAVADNAAPQQEQAPTVVDVSVDDDPALGPEDAPIVIVEFSDFRCPYCARFHSQTLYPLLDQYEGQIRLVYRDFPIVGGEQAALAAECADDQGVFWEYHDLLFENQSALSSNDALLELASQLDIDMDTFSACLENQDHLAEVEADFSDGVSYGVRGTPAFFVNGHPLVGAQPMPVFRQLIDELLAEQDAG